MPSKRNWLEVDLDGMSQVIDRKGAGFIALELAQNSIDAGARNISISIEPVPRKHLATLSVEDDGEGFNRLADAWMLFSPSLKRENPELRGRFNIGEKLVLARCTEALVETVTGSVAFEATGERKKLPDKRDTGTKFTATIKMKRDEIKEAMAFAKAIIPPEDCRIVLNGEVLKPPVFVKETTATLQTEYDDDKGRLRRTNRKTKVKLYKPRKGEESQIYEMGIPVLELSLYGMPYHVDVQQRVPLDLERNSVPPSYLEKIFKTVLEASYKLLTPESSTELWVTEALGASDVDENAVKSVIEKRFGKGAVAYDPSDVEGSKRAAAENRTVVAGRTFDKKAWQNIKRSGALPPAGQVTPSEKGHDKEGWNLLEDWNREIKDVVGYAEWVADAVGAGLKEVKVAVDVTKPFLATYGPDGILTLNKGKLGNEWFERFPENIESVTALLLHEYSHATVSDHLSRNFADKIAELGAKLASAVSERNEEYKAFSSGTSG